MPCALISPMISKTFSTKIGARPIEGSSSSNSFGCAISARPIAHICCSPPDSVPAFCSRRSWSRGKSWKTRSMSSLSPERSERWKAPISRFSRTDIRGNNRRPSGDCAMPCFTIPCGAAWVMSRPRKWIRPRRGWLRPLIDRSVVDLPAPLAPISVTTSPSFTVSEMPFSAWMAP